jgi:predicted O-methyltransferase YrrM
MSTLTSAPVAPLLAQLFADAAASDARLEQDDQLSMPTAADYRTFYLNAKDYHLAVSAETGRLLYMLARSCRARGIVEFGTSFGLSTLHLAAALKDNGGGRLIGSEFEPSKVEKARANLQRAGLSELVEIRDGDALQTLARDLPQPVDLVLLDGAKPLYLKVLKLLEPALRPGALIVGDNADWAPDYLEYVRAGSGRYLSVPFAEDVELSMLLK